MQIELNGVKYEPVNSGDLKIVVLDRGFVVIGNGTITDNYVTIRNCQCIRRWGTSRGLGELATEGPKTETQLDPQPTTRVHELQVVQMIDCDGAAWIQ